jgi:tetratricopeptide (TPR) repeat protein
MPTASPAPEWEAFATELSDFSVRKHELWLYQARRAFDRALQAGLLPAGRYHNLMGMVFGGMDRWADAIEHGRRAVQLDDEPLFKYNLAVSLSTSGEFDEAMQLFQQVVDADSSSVHGMLALASLKAEVGEWSAARRFFRKAVTIIDTESAEDYWRAAVTAEEVGLYTDAVRLMALHVAVRHGLDRASAEQDPLQFILVQPREVLVQLPDRYPAESVMRLLLLRETVAPAPPGDEDWDLESGTSAGAVLKEWAPHRARANAAVMDAE